MANNKLSIRNPNNWFRKKILSFVKGRGEFTLPQMASWFKENYPRMTPPIQKLASYMRFLPFVEAVGYRKDKMGRQHMVYRLREDYALDGEVQTEETE
tara:strand:- start:423 stop:716 length:294 start_codon:yes stop_codon:yes gene_type:complete